MPRSRKHSSLILTLSRVRNNDPLLTRLDPASRARKQFAGPHTPRLFTNAFQEKRNSKVFVGELNLPDVVTRLAMNAQDPLSSVHFFDFSIYVLLSGAFGIRMCFSCPQCNMDACHPGQTSAMNPCQDCCGKSTKPLGGIAALAEALAWGIIQLGEIVQPGVEPAGGIIELGESFS